MVLRQRSLPTPGVVQSARSCGSVASGGAVSGDHSQYLRRRAVSSRPCFRPDFRWHSVGTATFDQPNSLRVDDGTWWVSLNNQRDDWNLPKHRECSSYEQRKAGAELRAKRHQVRLRAEVDQRTMRLRLGKSFLRD